MEVWDMWMLHCCCGVHCISWLCGMIYEYEGGNVWYWFGYVSFSLNYLCMFYVERIHFTLGSLVHSCN